MARMEAFPFCPQCEECVDTRIAYRQETYTVQGKPVTVSVTAKLCVVCGETICTDKDDQDVLDAVHAAAEAE